MRSEHLVAAVDILGQAGSDHNRILRCGAQLLDHQEPQPTNKHITALPQLGAVEKDGCCLIGCEMLALGQNVQERRQNRGRLSRFDGRVIEGSGLLYNRRKIDTRKYWFARYKGITQISHRISQPPFF
jgi:hypothetical protein